MKAQKYRQMPLEGIGYGRWIEFEAETDSDRVRSAMHDLQCAFERWHPKAKAWVPASWRALSPSEQALIVERDRLIADARGRRGKIRIGLANRQTEIDAIDAEGEALAARRAVAEARKDAFVAEQKTLEAELAETDKRVAALEAAIEQGDLAAV
jgi:hypothetical protein